MIRRADKLLNQRSIKRRRARRPTNGGAVSRGVLLKVFLIRWVSNALALVVTSFLLPGVWFTDWTACLLGALVLGLLNAFVRPVLLFLTLRSTF